ncbi:RNA methyltransferase [Aeromonas dhakensis]
MAIPKGCINLAAAVNVILYDRLAKQLRGNSAS